MHSGSVPADLRPAVSEALARNGAHRRIPTRTATVLGLGHRLPDQIVSNGPIARRLGIDDEWIVRRTGVRTRRHVAPDERLSDLAAAAGRHALSDAGVEAADVDLVLVATMSADEITPNAAPLVAHALGARRAGAIDVGAACTAWLAGLSLAAAQVETGRAETVLVVGADVLSRLTNFDDRRTAALFGDGAGAVVVGPAGEGAIGPIELAADGGLAEAIVATHADRYLQMDGHVTFKIAVRVLAESTLAALARAGLELDDVDLFVYHQANARILRSVGEKLDIPPARIADYVGETGNTSAASIPLTLSLARADGRLRPGMKVLVSAVGAGFTWGAGVLEWEVP
jgi:3-oxoacyl-[acyl-carrier-protein] synthase-3